ncbi:MAG: thiol:disulfide interchange protein DsbA/DsbL [Pseudomonadota bacterium]
MSRALIACVSIALLATGSIARAAEWVAGQQYTVLKQAQPTSVAPGKVEVMEVFSYGCPACNQFQPVMRKLQSSLPPNAQLVYLPASWHAEENWPLLQRAYFTAQSLGLAEKSHEAMFDAVWGTGELGVADPKTGRKKNALPSIDAIAQFYQRTTGVKSADFVAASKSFGVDSRMRQADSQIIAMQVPSTPSLVVAGKYRINNETLSTTNQFVDLVKFLVAKESTPAAATKKP